MDASFAPQYIFLLKSICIMSQIPLHGSIFSMFLTEKIKSRAVRKPLPSHQEHCLAPRNRYAASLRPETVKPGLYFSRRQSPTVARLGDRRRQSRVCLYFNWRLSPAQVGDCRQQSPTVVFKVQQCWTFNAVASSRWHFPSNQRATTGFIRSRPMQTKEHKLLLNI